MLVELMLMSIHRHEVLGAGFFGGTAVSGKRGTWVEMWALYWVVLLEGGGGGAFYMVIKVFVPARALLKAAKVGQTALKN